MKILAWAIAHYGKEYMDCALQAVIPFSDKVIILYSSKSSQGFSTEKICPDTREELHAIAGKYPKVEFIDVEAANESIHTELIYDYCNGYDLLWRFDLDEVFEHRGMTETLNQIEGGTERYYAPSFKHFWKSFNHICTDRFQVVRFDKPKIDNTEVRNINIPVYHFGYCQNIKTIEYKMAVSGHRNEWRPDWLNLYKNWNLGIQYLHPVSKEIWKEVKRFDKNTLPEQLKKHDNFAK